MTLRRSTAASHARHVQRRRARQAARNIRAGLPLAATIASSTATAAAWSTTRPESRLVAPTPHAPSHTVPSHTLEDPA